MVDVLHFIKMLRTKVLLCRVIVDYGTEEKRAMYADEGWLAVHMKMYIFPCPARFQSLN